MVLKPRPNALSWLLLSLLVLVLDQLSKQWVLTSLPEYTAIPVIEGFWNWYRTYNTGAAFSFLSDAGGWQKWFFTVLAFGISGLLAVWLSRTPRGDWRTALPFALVIGGAIGNVVDRLQHGPVIDFIQWHWREHYWPAFNRADAAIGLVADGLGHAMRAEDHGGAVRHLVQLFHEDRAALLQVVDDEAVVHHYMAHVDRRTERFDGALDDLDGAVDAGAETTGIGEQDVHRIR